MKHKTPILAALAACATTLHAESSIDTQALLRKVEALEQKVQSMEQHLDAMGQGDSKAGPKGLGGVVQDAANSLKIGMYGETKVRSRDGEVRWDPHRLVLMPTYSFNEWITFNAEIEYEHGGAATDSGSKIFEGGNIEVEQAFLELRFNKHFIWRPPGVDLVPVGYINLFHEPTRFYSTERPPLYRELIPSTWFEMATSIRGEVFDGLDYILHVGAGLEEDGDNSSKSGNTAGITAKNGLRAARPAVGDFKQANDAPGVAFRLAYDPPFLPGFSGSSSLYWSEMTPERSNIKTSGKDNYNYGAYYPTERDSLGSTQVWMFDTEFRYRIPRSPLEFRGEFVHVGLEGAHNLIANNDKVTWNNVAGFMNGWSGEVAYHIAMDSIKQGMSLVPFVRYSRLNLQNGAAGEDDHDNFEENKDPVTGRPTRENSPDRHVWEAGLSWFATPQVVLKFDWKNELFDGGTAVDTFQFAAGFEF
jgi:hypothetical protein